MFITRSKVVPILVCAAIFLFCPFTHGAARLYIDSRPTTLDPSDKYCDMILREIPRQMLVTIAIDELGVDVVDASVEQGAVPQNDNVKLGLQRKQNRDGHVLHIDLFDGENQVIDKTDVSYAFLAHGLPQFRDMVARMDDQDHARWRSLLGQRLSATPHEPKWDASLPIPPHVESYLLATDFQSAFLAAQLTHQSIAESGESPARLGALVRAYTNLGEATRDLISPHSSAMFARAYIYAQRLMRKAPDDPASWWNRAYLESIHGMAVDAQDDFAHAEKLAKGAELPAWAELARLFLTYDTVALFSRIQGNNASLASYLAWRTVEHSCLPGLTMKLARQALTDNPGSLRLHDSIIGNSYSGESTPSESFAQNALAQTVASLANNDDVPVEVRQAITRAAKMDVDAMKRLLSAIQARDHSDEMHLPWSGYASMLKEWLFLQVCTQLSNDEIARRNATRDAKSSWPLVSDHRFALIVASFDATRQLAGGDVISKLKSMHLSDIGQAFAVAGVDHHLSAIGLIEEPFVHTNWNNFCIMQSDHTSFDAALTLWIFRRVSGPAFAADTINASNLLDQLSPNHPTALVALAKYDWSQIQGRAGQLEKTMEGNPTASYALGVGYAKSKQFDRAAALLTRAAQYSPDRPVYNELAELRLAQNDVPGYVSVWNRYMRMSDETPKELGYASTLIAYRLIGIGEPGRAVSFGKAGADANFSDGIDSYLLALTRSGRFDDAEKVLASDSRYPMGSYYRWCLETGHGNLAAAQPDIEASVARMANAPESANDIAVYYLLNGHVEQATDYLAAAVAQNQTGCVAHLLALIRLQQNRPDESKVILDKRTAMPKSDTRTRAYIFAAEQLRKCLDDPRSSPVVEGEFADDLAQPNRAATNGNVFYLFGRFCELRGDKEKAKQWYRKSLDSLSAVYTFRASAAVALRELGEEYYK